MEYFKQILTEISRIVQINSEQSAPEEGAPFGQGPKAALDCFLELADSFGFETKNYDGYAGEIVFGEGEEFAVLAHLDVVPAGNGWTRAPFGGEIDCANGRIWGRGTMDDKGPAVITLFAMKALKDDGFKPKRKIKLILGCNEETGWGCIDYYCKHAHMPDEGISPDADFPVIYAEKGILHVRLKFLVDGDFCSLTGGDAANMVCDRCEAVFPRNDELLTKLGLEYAANKAISHGKSAHGSTPEKGVNAIPAMLKYVGLEQSVLIPLENLSAKLQKLQDETGKLTFSPNVVRGGKDCVYITCDLRYPPTIPQRTVIDMIEESGLEYQILHEQAPLYNNRNGKLISTLCSVYNEITGKNMQPVAIGGGTYARALKNGAAFGPEEEGEESTIHRPDEYITFEKIERCFKIYKLALKRLTE